MAETIVFTKFAPRGHIYSEILPQVEALIAGETDLVANLANVAAVLHEALGFFWVGFYLYKDGQLVLGPFQGPIACTRIDTDKGVCGHSFTSDKTVIVPNVDTFPGHIACATASKSEIVIPIHAADGSVCGVLDVDSDKLDDFSQTDADGLGKIAKLLELNIAAGALTGGQ